MNQSVMQELDRDTDRIFSYGSPKSFHGKERKKEFLLSLKSDGKMQYKRYIASPLRYAGGKSLAVGHVIEHIPLGTTTLVSPFIGGGSVEIACANDLNMKVQGYDLFDLLANYWKIQLWKPRKLADRISKWEPTDEVYRSIKERLGSHWKKEDFIRDDLDLAAHYWFNHNLSYGPGFLGWMSKIYQEKERFKRLVEKVRNFRVPNLTVRQGSFENTIEKHKSDFLYCDPPYYLGGDSLMFRGIYPQRNFPVHHNGFDHVRLREMLHEHDNGFILSYNDCKVIRDWYSDFEIVEVKWQYTLGQGEKRIGKNRIGNGSNHHVKQSHELLILGT